MSTTLIQNLAQKFMLTNETAQDAVALFRKSLALPAVTLEPVEKPSALVLLPEEQLLTFGDQETNAQFMTRANAFRLKMAAVFQENKRRREEFNAAQKAFVAFSDQVSSLQRWHSSLHVALPSLLELLKDGNAESPGDAKRKRDQMLRDEQDGDEVDQPPKERRKIKEPSSSVTPLSDSGRSVPQQQIREQREHGRSAVTFSPEQHASLASLLVSLEHTLGNYLSTSSGVSDSLTTSDINTVVMDSLPVIAHSLHELASIGREWRSGQSSSPPSLSQIGPSFMPNVAPPGTHDHPKEGKLPEVGIKATSVETSPSPSVDSSANKSKLSDAAIESNPTTDSAMRDNLEEAGSDDNEGKLPEVETSPPADVDSSPNEGKLSDVAIDSDPTTDSAMRDNLEEAGIDENEGKLPEVGMEAMSTTAVETSPPAIVDSSPNEGKLSDAAIDSNQTTDSATRGNLPEAGSDTKRQCSADVLQVDDTVSLPVELLESSTHVNVPSFAQLDEEPSETNSTGSLTSSPYNDVGADVGGVEISESALMIFPKSREQTPSPPSTETDAWVKEPTGDVATADIAG